MSKGPALQDPFLNTLRKEHSSVSIFLMNGIKLQGQIESFDQFVVVLRNPRSLGGRYLSVERRNSFINETKSIKQDIDKVKKAHDVAVDDIDDMLQAPYENLISLEKEIQETVDLGLATEKSE